MPEFPEFTFIVFALPDISTYDANLLAIPGRINLWQGDTALGWG